MRTTLTIEDDVAARIARLRKTERTSLKEIVNVLLRRGLDALEVTRRSDTESYRLSTVRLEPRVTHVDNIAEVLAWAEGEDLP